MDNLEKLQSVLDDPNQIAMLSLGKRVISSADEDGVWVIENHNIKKLHFYSFKTIKNLKLRINVFQLTSTLHF